MDNPLYLSEHCALPGDFKRDQFSDNELLIKWDPSKYAKFPEGVERKRDDKSFVWQTYFRVGAQWLDKEYKQALVVTPKPKFENIDFLEMFLCCLKSGLAVNDFSKIYDIDFEQPAIQTNKLDNVLTPLIIIHFLTVVEGIAKRGLKRGYVRREENLKKVKGRIRILTNERKNVIPRRFDRVYCQYNEFTVDIPENRLIKKALLFAQKELLRFSNFKHYNRALLLENKCLAAFTQVSPEIELRDVKLIKSHKLFREYDLAVKLAKTILRRNDYSIKKASGKKENTPVFWLDMAQLFEMYVYSKLHEQYGGKIRYQFKGTGREKPDFLYIDENDSCILDAKYMDLDKKRKLTIIRQLAGYARDVKVLRELGYSSEKMADVVVPCYFLCPTTKDSNNAANCKILDKENRTPIKGWTKFYKIGIKIPLK